MFPRSIVFEKVYKILKILNNLRVHQTLWPMWSVPLYSWRPSKHWWPKKLVVFLLLFLLLPWVFVLFVDWLMELKGTGLRNVEHGRDVIQTISHIMGCNLSFYLTVPHLVFYICRHSDALTVFCCTLSLCCATPSCSCYKINCWKMKSFTVTRDVVTFTVSKKWHTAPFRISCISA